MSEFPFGYEKIDGTTWAYLSSLLMIALFFKFNRFWSVRNLDLVLIILLVPGLLMVEGGRQWVQQHTPPSAASSPTSLASPLDSNTSSANMSRQTDASALEKPVVPNSGMDPRTANPASDQDDSGWLARVSRKLSRDNLVSASLPDRTLPPSGTANSGTLVDGAPSTETVAIVIPDAETETKNTIGHRWQRIGYIWLFSAGLLILIRLIIDPSLTRRPMLEPNLSKGGLFFFGATLMALLTANVILSEPTIGDIDGGKNAVKMLQREAADQSDKEKLIRRGPGYPMFFMIPVLTTFGNGEQLLGTDVDEDDNQPRYVVAAKIMAITSQSLIVLGLILFCLYNYNNLAVGVGTASIYLMLPYTALFTGHVTHTLPAALMVWAFVCFRRPWLSGMLIGLATGVAYYPIFLLPLWASFYWERGARRFVAGLLVALAICIGGLVFTSVDSADFVQQLQQTFGFWQPRMDGLEGIWSLGWSSWWRLPILIAFVAYSVSFVAWPTEKNIGTLVGFTASILVAVQFWHGGGDGVGGGLYMAWYLPLLLLIIFRPNLEGRDAVAELRDYVRVKPESPEDLLPTG